MSAYIVSHATINAILTFGARERQPLRISLQDAPALYFDNPDDLQRAAEILLGENYRSVCARYPGRIDPAGDVIGFAYCRAERHLQPVQILKLCDCFDYQACETGNYPDTDAWRIVSRVRAAAIAALPGYRDAEWGL